MSTYQLCYSTALLLGAMLALRRLVVAGIDHSKALRIWFVILWGGLLGSWFIFQLVYQAAAVLKTGSLMPLDRGTTVIGGLIGGLLGAMLAARIWHEPLGRVLDLVILPVPLAQAIGRLGCLAQGCCAGRATDSWIGIELVGENSEVCQRFPTQIMSAVADLGFFVALIALERRFGRSEKGRAGRLVFAYAVMYCGKRFVLGFFREGTPVLLGFSWDQLVSGITLIALIGFAKRVFVSR